MRYTKAALVAIIALSAALAAKPAEAARPLNANGLSLEAGKIDQKNGRDDLYFASIIPQFSFGRVTAVLNINYIATKDYKIRRAIGDVLVLDSLNYDGGEKFNLRYGEIKNLTLGSGFIVSNYRSDILGNVPLNRQRGLKVDLKGGDSGVTAFGTQSDLFGARGERELDNLIVGATVVTGSSPGFHAIGGDISTHFKSERLKMYVETATIINHGRGGALGALVKPRKNFSFNVELREFSSRFIPGMVDEHFEAGSPFLKVAGVESAHGTYTAVDYSSGKEKHVAASYELYKNREPRTTFKASGRITPSLSGDIFYAQENFVPKGGTALPKNSIVRAILTYRLTRKLDVAVDYYHAYDVNLAKQDSITLKARVKLH